MKFLIFGCNGMAGHMISLYLKEKGYVVHGFARKESPFIETIKGDATDVRLVRKAIGVNKFDTIINCIGVLNKNAEDNKTNAIFLNSYFPHLLAELTEGTDTQVIHMSTDCVFSGQRGQYMENDFCDGRTFYDRTKALGEINDSKNLTLRQSIVGPDINAKGIGLLNWFLQQEEKVNGYIGAVWTGQTTLQLAKTMEQAALQRVNGLYNMVPDDSITKYDLLNLFNKYIRKKKIEIIPVDKMAADKSLKRTNWEFAYVIPNYEQMVIELAKWMQIHKGLYPHYDL